jgi:hypothetical protein
MKKIMFFSVLIFGIVCLTLEAYPAFEFGRTLEKPEWGMIEWSSATLPQGFWYPSLEFMYVHTESYFKEGKEVDFPGGRDSTAYIAGARLIYGLLDNLNLGVFIPFMLDQKVDSGMYGEKARLFSGASNVGDVQLWAKYHFINRYFWSVATELGTSLPTGIPHNKVSSQEAATGDGQTDLDLALNGDILLTEEAFVKLGTRFLYQFKRTYRDEGGDLVDEKLGNSFGIDAGFVKNFKNMGFGGSLQYTFWQATKVDKEVVAPHGDLFNLFLQLSLGDLSPEKHGKLDFTLDFPMTGKNAPVTYRLGVSLKTIFR